jgi:hypothetical protein
MSPHTQVDLLEMSQRFLDYAVGYVNSPSLGALHCAPMHAFEWGGGQTWSLVWVQWCAIYLPDKDFVSGQHMLSCLHTLSPPAPPHTHTHTHTHTHARTHLTHTHTHTRTHT